MRALLQRVRRASVTVDGELVGSIGSGLCALVGVTHDDDAGKARRLAAKMWGLRIFPDRAGVANLSASDLQLPVLVVSQFTLYADASRGRRPSYVGAAPAEQAEALVAVVCEELATLGARVETGRFRADMQVELVNDGPFTVLIDT